MSADIIPTGIPRSGTTLTCHLLNKVANTVALHEPLVWTDYPDLTDHEAVCDGVNRFFAETRRSLLTDGTAMTQHVEGEVPDNPMGGYPAYTHLARFLGGLLPEGNLLSRLGLRVASELRIAAGPKFGADRVGLLQLINRQLPIRPAIRHTVPEVGSCQRLADLQIGRRQRRGTPAAVKGHSSMAARLGPEVILDVQSDDLSVKFGGLPEQTGIGRTLCEGFGKKRFGPAHRGVPSLAISEVGVVGVTQDPRQLTVCSGQFPDQRHIAAGVAGNALEIRHRLLDQRLAKRQCRRDRFHFRLNVENYRPDQLPGVLEPPRLRPRLTDIAGRPDGDRHKEGRRHRRSEPVARHQSPEAIPARRRPRTDRPAFQTPADVGGQIRHRTVSVRPDRSVRLWR